MKKYFDSLRPFERRVLVVVASVVFLVLNFWFVFPHFSDWNNSQMRMAEARNKLEKFQKEISQMPTYERQIKSLGGANLDVLPEDQSSQFARAVQMQQAQSGVNITSTSKMQTRTNQFFLELSQNVGVQSGEQQLVDFLYNLGAGNSQIRVRDFSLRPDPPRLALVANVKLVASYQKAAPVRKAPATGAASASTATAKRP
jgi:type II secretory pathway component PulM